MSGAQGLSPLTLIEQLRAYFHPKDRSVYLADLCTLHRNSLPFILHAGSLTYNGYPFTLLTVPLTSTSWDGDAKTGASATIDLSAVFGAPAGIKAALVTMYATDETVGVNFYMGPDAAHNTAIWQKVLVANQNIGIAGCVPCDANGDVYWGQSAELDEVYISIWGYAI